MLLHILCYLLNVLQLLLSMVALSCPMTFAQSKQKGRDCFNRLNFNVRHRLITLAHATAPFRIPESAAVHRTRHQCFNVPPHIRCYLIDKPRSNTYQLHISYLCYPLCFDWKFWNNKTTSSTKHISRTSRILHLTVLLCLPSFTEMFYVSRVSSNNVQENCGQ